MKPNNRRRSVLDESTKAERRIEEAFQKFGLPLGRSFGSKLTYLKQYPRHRIIFNACVFSRTRGLIWGGDLDLTRDKPSLNASARILRIRLYVLSELDGQFEDAVLPHSEVVRRAIWHTGTQHIAGAR